MTFDANFYFDEAYVYGYIFRIINKEGDSIDLVMGVDNMVFSLSPGSIAVDIPTAEAKLVPGQWIKVKLDADLKNEELKIRIGNYSKSWSTSRIADFQRMKIMFGKTDYPEKQVIDVANMAIRNIEIKNTSGKPLYSWPLSKHHSEGVYDDLKGHFAECENPNWMLDKYVMWKKEATFETRLNPYLAYDPGSSIVAIADQNSFFTFDMGDSRLEKYATIKKLPYAMSSNQMIHSPIDSVFYAYNLLGENEARELIPYDFAERSWGDAVPHQNLPVYRHHNRYLSREHKRLYIFGGYGHLTYRKGVFIYDIDDKRWTATQLKGDAPEPRYLGGLGKIDDNHLLLFGGYGSETGNQSLQSHFYYDLLVVNLNTLEAKKIWTMENPPENFVVSNSIVVDRKNGCFYALCYPSMRSNSRISLYKFSLDKPQYEIMADTIPIKFIDTGSYVDLFLDSSCQKLITATISPATDTTSNVSIYSLAFPPLSETDLYPPKKREAGIPLYVAAVISFAVFAVFALSTAYYVRRKKRSATAKRHADGDERDEPDIAGSKIGVVKRLPEKAIILFGGFRIVDMGGNDITTDFRPLLKNLFLLILLHTIKNGKGIPFSKLKDILWFDKSERSANNNRGVALNKIRQIFKKVGNVRFVKNGIHWNVEFEQGVYCDYYEALLLIKKIKEGEETDRDVAALLSIVKTGELLPNLENEWIDAFKSDFSNELVDAILKLIRQKDTEISDILMVEMANALFIHDPLNEDALRLKCSALVKMGKNGLARNTYNAFVKEYSVLFATEYKYSFSQIICDI